jgi:hypothetical protein
VLSVEAVVGRRLAVEVVAVLERHRRWR